MEERIIKDINNLLTQLFQKMHEAGYEWDVDKKELKKIDKENLTEFEIAVKNVMEEAIEAGDTHNLKADAENLLRITQPTWSEDDEKLAQAKKDAYNDALDKIEYHSGEPTFDDGWDAAIWYLKKKNAQPQSQWKPSESDILLVERIANGKSDPQDFQASLCCLIEQLKKLREE